MIRPLICLVFVALVSRGAQGAEKPCDPAWATAKAFADHAAKAKSGCVCGTTCACKPGQCPGSCPLATPVVTPAVQVAAPACRTVRYVDRYGRVVEYTQCPLKK